MKYIYKGNNTIKKIHFKDVIIKSVEYNHRLKQMVEIIKVDFEEALGKEIKESEKIKLIILR